jgi:hypothetical protein
MTCLSTRQINSTNVVDAKTIDFKLNNGQIYRNTMRSSCNRLRFFGFICRSFGGQICDYQSISILQSAEICALGAFAKNKEILRRAPRTGTARIIADCATRAAKRILRRSAAAEFLWRQCNLICLHFTKQINLSSLFQNYRMEMQRLDKRSNE